MNIELLERIKKRKKGVGPDGRKFKLSKPAKLSDIDDVEKELRFLLPDTLKELYLEVGNGGFGPGYGVMGIPGGFTDDQGNDILSLYNSYRESDPEDPSWLWPEGLVPICHWGCVIYSCVHCLEENMPVYNADIGVIGNDDPVESILKLDKPSFDEWVMSWE